MPIEFWVLIGCLAFLIVLRRTAKMKPPSLPTPSYAKKRYFFTTHEQPFYKQLKQAVPMVDHQFVLFAKVEMSDVVRTAKGVRGRSYHVALNRVNQKHADFVVFKPIAPENPGQSEGLEPILVIELDDPSHEREDRRARDALVNSIYTEAALPILHVPPSRGYDPRDLARKLRAALALPEPPATLGLPTKPSIQPGNGLPS